MNPELVKRIDSRDTWTFDECLGLASEFGIKPRAVIALVMMNGKTYVELPADSSQGTDADE